MKSDFTDLRTEAEALFAAAVKAADPAEALRRHLNDTPLPKPDDGRYILIAFGKAACTMMAETLNHIPPGTPVSAIAVPNYENAKDIPGCCVLPAGHPVPDENGARAARAVIGLLQDSTGQDRVIALISGGGSALLPAPVPGISLEDKAEVSRTLLAAGFDITEMNMVRQQLSRLKGGGLARLAAPAPVQAYILSDVIGDDLRVIASGPTVEPIATLAETVQLLKTRGVLDSLPASVQSHLSGPKPADSPVIPSVTNTLLCSNHQSLVAAKAAAKRPARIVEPPLIGNVAEAANRLLSAARLAGGPCALIFGGETTVRLTGTGTGGRNQELALRFALGAADLADDWVFLSGGTDGRDGPTDAAGGLVDPGSIARMKAAGADPKALLGNNDSHAALMASGDLLMTGPTGTNVADVQVFLRRQAI